MKRKIVVVIAIIVVLALIAVPLITGSPLVQGQTPGQTATGKQTAVNKVIIDKGDFKVTVSATGSLVANRQVQISFAQEGRVQTVAAQEGQSVEAGQILATQDDSVAKANLAQAEFNVKAAEASLQKVLAPVDAGEIAQAEANVKSAQASYSSLVSSTSQQDVKTYELKYQKALAAQQTAKTKLEQDALKYQKADPNYQTYLAQYGQATFSAEIARLQLQQAKMGQSLTSATAKIAYQQTLLAQLKAGPKQTEIDAAQASFELAKLKRDAAQHTLDKMHLVAPFAGTVITVNVKPGEISSGAAVIVSDTDDLYASIDVDETDIGQLAVGQPVELTLDAVSGVTLTGKIQRIAQTADTTASVITYTVRVALDPTKAPVKVGMTANAVFQVRHVQNILRVPSQYVRVNLNTQQTTVTLLNADGTTTEVPVKLGVQGTDYSEVIDGLAEGETVILSTNTQTTNAAKPA